MNYLLLIFFWLGCLALQSVSASELDDQIQLYVKRFRLAPINPLPAAHKELFKAGELLFKDELLSGNRNISCQSCHDPKHGTSDGLALAIGTGGSMHARGTRVQDQGKVIRRNSPALFNLGHPGFSRMFWDGRVRNLGPGAGFRTPEPAFNGKTPEAQHIVVNFKRALDAQTVFPLVNHDEMRGPKGSNEIADAQTNLEAWERLVQRLKHTRPEVVELLLEAYPNISLEQLNIGHVGAALGEFISHQFQVHDTPYDNYLRGNKSALTLQQKRGLLLFANKAKCTICHFGPELTNDNMQNIGVPLLKASNYAIDLGQHELTGIGSQKYTFKTPQLRNVARSAPYMHNGVFSTLKQVVDHYDSLEQSLRNFKPLVPPLVYRQPLEHINDHESCQDVLSTVFQPFLLQGLGLSTEEKADLVEFLSSGLLSPEPII